MIDRLPVYQARIEQVLDQCLTLPDSGTARLREAMRYSVLGGGKRLRPVLVYTTGEALGAPLEHLDLAAAAVELVHVYSLVHDDLPAMDDDDLRRGAGSGAGKITGLKQNRVQPAKLCVQRTSCTRCSAANDAYIERFARNVALFHRSRFHKAPDLDRKLTCVRNPNTAALGTWEFPPTSL